jgi:GT2 family glycosyltransferase
MARFLAFLGILLWSPRKALAAAWWYITRRRVRSRIRLREAANNTPFAYAIWARLVEAELETKSCGPIEERLSRLRCAPRFTIALCADPAKIASRRSIASVLAQPYDRWELILVVPTGSSAAAFGDDALIRLVEGSERNAASRLNAAIAAASGDYIVPLDANIELAPNALLHLAEAIDGMDKAEIVFGDSDALGKFGRADPWFKPEWNAEMFLAQDYLSDACAIATDLARRCGPLDAEFADCASYALLLGAVRHVAEPPRHVPHILAHSAVGRHQAGPTARAAAVRAHLSAAGAHIGTGPFGTVRVSWPLPDPLPLVSIIIPTRDKRELLETCIESLTRLTRYPAYELIVVDNGSSEPATLAYLDALSHRPDARVVRYPGVYNFSAINNFAVGSTRGEHLCLLNNDTEVIDGSWLDELMRYAVRPEVGAVGPRLLYPDRSIQHAGVVIGMGEAAGHAHRHLPDGEEGYFAQAYVSRYVSAVTAACLVVAKAKFEAVGGLDADGLAIAFNDVDLCLKLQAAGWRNVYVPHAPLIHHESKSRGNDISPEHIERYMAELGVLQQRWGTKTYRDPLHHPRLDRYSETYLFRFQV